MASPIKARASSERDSVRVLTSEDCAWVDYVQWEDTGENSATLRDAMDMGWKIVTGGDSNWYRVTRPAYNGGDSARSGSVGHSQKSQMEATVVGAGTVSFWWKVSSESGCDELEFYLDNTLKHAISGEADWAQKSYNITGSGTHTLKWRYYKDGSVDEGDDRGWVDYVQWSGYVAPDPTLVPTVWETITYTYDPAGRRIAKAYDGTTIVKYLYDGDHCLAEYGGSDQLLRKYVYGPGVDQPVCLIETAESNAAYYYHFDGLGSVVALSNAAGSTAQLYEYSVYGQVAASDPNHPNRFMFTAREFDADTGLYYYRARYYNPYIGRFLQTDPVREGMNWYAYCGNDPTGFVDPPGSIVVRQWVDGKLVATYHPLPAFWIPDDWQQVPVNGLPWNINNFWWHYVHGRGETVDFGAIGLLEGFKGDKIVAGLVTAFKAGAHQVALKKWNEMDAEIRRWEEMRDAGIWPLPPYPENGLKFTAEVDGWYDFMGYNVKKNPLYILGRGKLQMTVQMTIRRFKAGGGSYDLYFTFYFRDWFIDVLDPFNLLDDATYGYLDYDNGVPFYMEGGWNDWATKTFDKEGHEAIS